MNLPIRFTLFFCFAICLFAFGQKGNGVVSESLQMEFDKHFFQGLKEKMIHNYPESEVELKNSIKLIPKISSAHYELATVLLAQKKQSESLVQAKIAFELSPENEWMAKFLIELLKNEKEYKEAIAVSEKAYKASSNLHFLFEYSGLCLLTGNPKKALSALNAIEKKQGITELVSRQKEEIYLSLNKINMAIPEIEKLCKAYPDQIKFKGILADLYMAGNKQKEGLAIYKEIQHNDSLNGYAAFALSDFYKEKKDTNAYLNQLFIGIKSNIDASIKVQILTQIIPAGFFGSDHDQRCKELVEAFCLSNPTNAEPHALKADLLMKERKVKEAREFYVKALQYNPESLQIWEQLLFCDQTIENYDLLMEDCKKVLEQYPFYTTGYLLYGIACKKLKMYDSAIELTRKGLTYSDSEISLIQLLANLGDIAHYAGNYHLSDSSFEAILALDPNQSITLNNYAYFLSLRNQELDKADNMSKRSIELDPHNASNLDTYGWILFQKKNFKEALIYIEKSLQLSPDNAEVYDHLGDVQFMLNEKESALKSWMKAKSLGLNDENIVRKIKMKSILIP